MSRLRRLDAPFEMCDYLVLSVVLFAAARGDTKALFLRGFFSPTHIADCTRFRAEFKLCGCYSCCCSSPKRSAFLSYTRADTEPEGGANAATTLRPDF